MAPTTALGAEAERVLVRTMTSGGPATIGGVRSRHSPWEALKADTWRQYDSWTGLIVGAVTRRTFRAVVPMRRCQTAASSRGILRLALPVFKALHRLASIVVGNPVPILKDNCAADGSNPAPV
jgi:hypothetical protein